MKRIVSFHRLLGVAVLTLIGAGTAVAQAPLTFCEVLASNFSQYALCSPTDGGGSPQILSTTWGLDTNPLTVSMLVHCPNAVNDPHIDRVRYTISAEPGGILSVTPGSVKAGTTATGTMALPCAIPVGEAPFPLANSNPGAATVPSNVTILAGNSQGTFAILTQPSLDAATVTISTHVYGELRTATLQIEALTPAEMTLLVSQRVSTLANGGVLNAGVANSLHVHLQSAAGLLAMGDLSLPSVRIPAVSHLQAFNFEVRGLVTAQTLTVAQGHSLMDPVQMVIDRISG